MYLWANENHSHFCQSVFESVFSVHILQYWEFVVDWHLVSAVAGTTSLALHVLQSFGSFVFSPNLAGSTVFSLIRFIHLCFTCYTDSLPKGNMQLVKLYLTSPPSQLNEGRCKVSWAQTVLLSLEFYVFSWWQKM